MDIQDELINRAGGRSYVLNLPDSEFEPFFTDGRYGAKLESLGLIIISPTYDHFFIFRDGIAIVQRGHKYGAINKLGELILPTVYDYLDDFYEGLARIKINGKWGYINAYNKVIIPCQYEDAGNFNTGVAPVRDKGMWFYIDTNNKLAILPKYPYKQIENFVEGFAVVCYNNGKYGFINKKGEEVIATKYEEVEPFQNERALVRINGKYGFINYKGKMVIPAIYDAANSFDESGLAKVTKIKTISRDRVVIYINKEGEFVKQGFGEQGIVSEIAEKIWNTVCWIFRHIGQIMHILRYFR